jgi:hypothetical protein
LISDEQLLNAIRRVVREELRANGHFNKKYNKETEDKERMWTRKEIANWYRVHPSTVHRWEKAGLLPAPEKAFGHRLWSRKAVMQAIRLAEKES